MKKISALLAVLMLLLAFCSCGEKEEPLTTAAPTTVADAGETEASTAEQKEVKISDVAAFDTIIKDSEYTLYTDIFYNQTGDQYVGETVTKKGTFATLYDEYNKVVRYYVWGYRDKTRCCDWQWEIVPTDTSSLPANGSMVNVTGTFEASDAALDGYWLTGVSIKVVKDYKPVDCDFDMLTMSATLERVQIINMQQKSELFEGKTVALYGRVMTPKSVQHPYYDSAWSQDFLTDDAVPDVDSVVIIKGVFRDGALRDCEVMLSDQY